MNRKELIIVALNSGHRFTPVQVQKLFFLIDRNISNQLGGPFFNFSPYDYGPFDKEIYKELLSLQSEGIVKINAEANSARRSYQLTEKGENEANEIKMTKISVEALGYINSLADFIRKLSFVELVSAIYKAYPEMKINSVFAQQ